MGQIRQHVAAVMTLAGLISTAPVPVQAQSVLERSPNLPGAWTGIPGTFYATLPHRFAEVGVGGFDLEGTATFDLALALPGALLVGTRFAPSSPVVPERTVEWEPYLRWTPFRQYDGAPLDAGVALAYNGAARSGDVALQAARWMGALRLLAEARAMTAPFGGDDTRFALGAGGVLHVASGRLPVALAADVATLLDPATREQTAWSAGVLVGIPFTENTFSLQVSNSPTTTVEGRSLGLDELFYGFELTVPMTIGSLFGLHAPRERAVSAVRPDARGEVTARVPIRRYAFLPQTVEIEAGGVVEWTNLDAVTHTVNAEDGAYHSGPIEQGGSWRARFDRPGRYAYFCGPHPYMKGMVIVR